MTLMQCPAPFIDLKPHPELDGYWMAPDGTLLIDADGEYVDPETMEKFPPEVQESVRNNPGWDLTQDEWDRYFEALGISI